MSIGKKRVLVHWLLPFQRGSGPLVPGLVFSVPAVFFLPALVFSVPAVFLVPK